MAEHIDDGARFTEIGGQFHDEVVRGCGNHTMIAVVGSLETLWTGHLNWWAQETAASGEYPSMSKRRIALTIHNKITDAIEPATATAPASCRPAISPTPSPTSSQPIPSNGSWRCRRRRWPGANAERCCVRTALITGGSGGIGKACGRKLVELGYDVVLTARREEPLRAAAEEMGARYVVADATRPEKFAPAVEAAGEIDLLSMRREFSAEPMRASRLSSSGARRCRPTWIRVSL